MAVCSSQTVYVQELMPFLPLEQSAVGAELQTPEHVAMGTSYQLKHWSDVGWQLLCFIKVRQFRCNKSFSKGSSIYYA